MPKSDPTRRGTFCGLKNRRRCGRCKKVKHYSQFHKNRAKRGGIGGYCKKCRKERYQETEKGAGYEQRRRHYYETARWKSLLLQYGVTQEQYEEMHQAQNGLCAICGKPETYQWRGTVRRLAVDHDHKTGAARGLLCTSCNRGIGNLGDDPEMLKKAIEYLLSYQTE